MAAKSGSNIYDSSFVRVAGALARLVLTLSETNIAPENRVSKMESRSFSTPILQGQAVSFRKAVHGFDFQALTSRVSPLP